MGAVAPVDRRPRLPFTALLLLTGGAGCDKAVPGLRCPGQTQVEYETEMSLWSMAAAQLLVATDLRNLTDGMKKVLLNQELIALDQDPLGVAGGPFEIEGVVSEEKMRGLVHSWILLLVVGSTAADDVPTLRKHKPSWQGRFATYSIASVARKTGRTDWNEITQGNKIVLPRSVYEMMLARGIPFTQFQILNPDRRDTRLFTGPLEFCAADGECYLPSWVMKQLHLKEGEACAVATACFPSAE